jgi:hypothetical protein
MQECEQIASRRVIEWLQITVYTCILSPARLPIPPHRQPLIVKDFQPLLQCFIFQGASKLEQKETEGAQHGSEISCLIRPLGVPCKFSHAIHTKITNERFQKR